MLTLGNRINFLRTKSNLSLDELSSILSTAKSTLSRIENDKVSPSSDTLLSISRFFNVSTDWLLTGTELHESKTASDKKLNKYFSILEVFNCEAYEIDDSFLETALEIGDRIWYMMEQLRFSSQSLSKYINETFSPFFTISPEEIISFHYGKKFPSKENLFILSKVFNVTCEWILVGDTVECSRQNNSDTLDFDLGKRIAASFEQISLPIDIKAKAIGITVEDFFDYQYGNIPEKCILEKISYFCNVSIEWLVTGNVETLITENNNLHKIHDEFKLSDSIVIKNLKQNNYDDFLPLLTAVPDELIDEIKKYIEFRISYLKNKNIVNSKSS